MCELDTNGLILSNTYFPEEIIVNILVYMKWTDLRSCRLVCRSWRKLIDCLVSLDKLKRFNKKKFRLSFSCPIEKLKGDSIPFYLYFAISKNVFITNHLKNPFGSGSDPSHVCKHVIRNPVGGEMIRNCSIATCPKFIHWKTIQLGGDGWDVEDVPAGCQPLPEHLEGKSCFVTSYGRCKKMQQITLAECGLNSKIMDDIQPHIEISEWYARRFDCGAVYKLRVLLLNSDKIVVDEFNEEVTELLGDQEWHQVSHTFKDYGPGVRHVIFEHEGRDTQFWAGYYGSKMAGGSVVAKIPSSLFDNVHDGSKVHVIEKHNSYTQFFKGFKLFSSK